MSDIYNDAYMKIAEVAGSKKKNKLNHIPWEQIKNVAEIINLNPNKKVLDAGCGIGGIAKYYSENYGVKVTAVDCSPKVIEYAKKNNSSPLVSYIVGSFPEVLSQLDNVDVILCILWLADVKEGRFGLLKKFTSKLSKDGYLVIADWLTDSSAKNEVLEQVRLGWNQSKYITLQNFRDHLKKAGLKIIKEIDLSEDLKEHWSIICKNLSDGKDALYASADKNALDERIQLIENTRQCVEEGSLCAPLLIYQKH